MADPIAPEQLREQAIAWLVRVNDPEFADWAEFEGWLGASPDHSGMYHRVAAAEADAVAAIESAPVTRPAAPAQRSRPGSSWVAWGSGAVAAALIAAVGIHELAPVRPPDRTFESAPGVRRTIALADGSSVTLNGGSRLTLLAGDARSARLDRGEALFVVRHDPNAPFRLRVGGDTITDVGTTFDVVRDAATTRIGVAEGAIDWRRGDGGGARLAAGRSLRAHDGSEAVELTAVAPAAVGSWSRGELDFAGEPLGTAAADLARALGITLAVPQRIAHRPVRATVQLEGSPETVTRRFAALLGLEVRRDGDGWRLTAAS